MRLPRKSFRVLMLALAFFLAGSGTVSAGVILSPVAVVGNTMGTANGNVARLFDQSGLSLGFTSGVTDYGTYIGAGPTHALNSASNAWSGTTIPGHLDFDLGAPTQITSFVLWTQANSNAVNRFSLISALDSGFTTGVTNLGGFGAVIGLGAQTFSVSGFGEYLRLEVLSNHGGMNINIGEVAIESSVPEPTTLSLFALALGGLAFRMRKRA